jgi:sigma-E factor negative regulatory protein RseC
MLEEDARVLEIRGDSVVVETSRQTACDGCGARTGCGTGLLSQLFGARKARFVVKNTLDLEVGNEVVIAVSEAGVLKGALLVYVLPLLAMFLGAILAHLAFSPASEGVTIAASAAGFLVTLGWVRARHGSAAGDTRFQPVVVRRKPPVLTLVSPRFP